MCIWTMRDELYTVRKNGPLRKENIKNRCDITVVQ